MDEIDMASEKLEVTVDADEILKKSRIYGNPGASEELTSYQSAINKAAYEICTTNPTLIDKKGDLLQAARRKVNADGYQYAKRSSRSKLFGTQATATNSNTAKKPRLSTDVRSSRILECQDDLNNINLQLKYAERAQEKFANAHQYQSAIGALKEIKEMKEKKRDIQRELEVLQKREAKAVNYQKKKPQKKTQMPPSKQDTATTSCAKIDSYLTSATSSGNMDQQSPVFNEVNTDDVFTSDSGASEQHFFE